MAAAVFALLSDRDDVSGIYLNGMLVRQDDPRSSLVMRATRHPPTEDALGRLVARLRKRVSRKRISRGKEQAEGIGPGDVAFDVNGYRHGERWGIEPLKDDLDLARHVQASGGRFIHMPKSYGPFSEMQRPLIGRLCALVDQIYARDQASFERVAPFCDLARVKLSPDYTCAVAPAAPPGKLSDLRDFALIIPNDKLVETGAFAGTGDYVRYLTAIADRLEALSANPVFLFHQMRDALIYRRVLEKTGRRCLLFTDPLVSKGAIARADFVVSARYHGMVSALTQERPGIFFGWTDKYLGFLDLFGLASEALVGRERIAEGPDLVEAAWHRRHDPLFRTRLREGAERIRAHQAELWCELSSLVGS